MSKSAEMKSIRRNIWISAGIIGIIQYSSIISAILMKNKWPFLIALPFMIGYGIGVTFYYQQKVAYLCPNCQHIFSPIFVGSYQSETYSDNTSIRMSKLS